MTDYLDDLDDIDDFYDNEECCPVISQPKPTARFYNNALSALCQGTDNRVLLLKESYRFADYHQLSDVQHHEFEGEGYLAGGVSVSFKSIENNTLILESIQFDYLEGFVYGFVVYNECGLIVHYPIYTHVEGSSLTIQGE